MCAYPAGVMQHFPSGSPSAAGDVCASCKVSVVRYRVSTWGGCVVLVFVRWAWVRKATVKTGGD